MKRLRQFMVFCNRTKAISIKQIHGKSGSMYYKSLKCLYWKYVWYFDGIPGKSYILGLISKSFMLRVKNFCPGISTLINSTKEIRAMNYYYFTGHVFILFFSIFSTAVFIILCFESSKISATLYINFKCACVCVLQPEALSFKGLWDENDMLWPHKCVVTSSAETASFLFYQL